MQVFNRWTARMSVVFTVCLEAQRRQITRPVSISTPSRPEAPVRGGEGRLRWIYAGRGGGSRAVGGWPLWWIQSRLGVIHHAALLTSILLGAVYVAALMAVGTATSSAPSSRDRGVGEYDGRHAARAAARLWRGVGLAALTVVILPAGWLVDALNRQPVPGRAQVQVQLARKGLHHRAGAT